MSNFLERFLHIRCFLTLCGLVGVIAALIYGRFVISDNFEHLRAAYLVSLGYVPYRDFFEHHHPLLWYLFAPIIAAVPHNALAIYYIVRSIVLAVSGLTFYVIYRIIGIFSDSKKLFGLFLLLLCTFLPMWYGISLFKPDAFAHLFYFIGLYYLFDYIRLQHCLSLVYGALAAAISFLFLQTIAFSIVLWIFPLLILLFKHKKFYSDLAVSVASALVVLGGFLYWIYATGAWTPYWQQNWIFNAQLFPLLQTEAPSVVGLWLFPLGTAAVAGVWIWKTPDTSVYWKIIAFLFVGEIAQRLLFKIVFPHYLILTFIFAALLLAYAVQRINQKILYGYVYAYVAICIALNFVTLSLNDNRNVMKDFRKVNESAQSLIFNIDFNYTNIYAPLNSYYTVTFNNLAMIDNYLFNRFPNYNINTEIQNQNFEYLCYAAEHKNITLPNIDTERFRLSEQTLQKYKQISSDLYRKSK